MTDLVTDRELKILQAIGDANARGQQLRDREIADICEMTIEDVKLCIGSLSAKGYIRGVVLPGGRV